MREKFTFFYIIATKKRPPLTEEAHFQSCTNSASQTSPASTASTTSTASLSKQHLVR